MQETDPNYGERTCLWCGKKFTALKPCQLYCTDMCYKESKRKKDSLRQRDYVKKLKNELEESKAEIAKLKKELEMNKAGMLVCERMHLRAMTLPCGERDECFLKPVCEHAPKKK